MGQIELGVDDQPFLELDDQAAELRSREALLAQLGATRATRPRAPAPRRSRRVWVPAAAVAAMLLLFFSPWWGTGPQLEGLEVVRVEDGRLLRSGSDAALRTGDAFALAFELSEEASVVVYHVDPGGRLTLVLPESPDRPAPRMGAGTVAIPGEGAGEQWVLGGDPGPESFVLALDAGSLPSLTGLDSALREGLPATVAREDVLRYVRSYLRSHLDEVEVIEFDHRP